MRTTPLRVWRVRHWLFAVLLAALTVSVVPGSAAAQSSSTPPATRLQRQTYPKVCLMANLRLKSTAAITKAQCAIVRAQIDSLNLLITTLNRTVILVPATSPTSSTSTTQWRVAITRPSNRLKVDSTLQLTGVVKTNGGATVAGQTIVWSAAPTTIATVNASTGLVTGVRAGAVVVSAAVVGAPLATRSTNLTVVASTLTPPPAPTPTLITITPANPTIVAGVSLQLTGAITDAQGNPVPTATTLWASSAPSKATVSAGGLVVGVAAGTTTITASTAGYPLATRSTVVTVTAPVAPSPASIAISPANPTLLIGATQLLTGTVKDSSGSTLGGHTVTWGSSAPGIATVNASTGLVTAISAGTATVVASTSGYPAATRTTTVTVTAPPAPTPALIAITPAGATLSIGATQQMTGVVKDSSGRRSRALRSPGARTRPRSPR
jgi:uncharacterized protein YjdB